MKPLSKWLLNLIRAPTDDSLFCTQVHDYFNRLKDVRDSIGNDPERSNYDQNYLKNAIVIR